MHFVSFLAFGRNGTQQYKEILSFWTIEIQHVSKDDFAVISHNYKTWAAGESHAVNSVSILYICRILVISFSQPLGK